MSNQSVIEHKANMYFLEFREDYLLICLQSKYKKPVQEGQKCKASAHCKALILAIMEGWTNDKRGKGQDLSVYMTYPQWIDAMYGMFGRTVVIDSLDELIGEKLISRQAHRMYGKDTFKYLLNCAEINKRMKNLEARDVNVTRPLVNASTSKPYPSTSKPVTRPLVDEDAFTSGRNIESTNNLNLDTTKKDIVVPASQNDASLTFHPFYNFIALDDPISPKTIVVYLTSKAYESEMEDDRRGFIAQEVKFDLEQQGHVVTYRWERTKEAVVVNAGVPQETHDNHSHSFELETSLQAANSTTISEVAPLPISKTQNAPCEEKTDNSTPLPENGSQVAKQEASDVDHIALVAATEKLIDVPLGPPTMPLDSAKWCAETCVEIVETLLNTRFSEKVRGNSKKQTSPRQRQLEAAKKVYSVVTREEFTRAYIDTARWWSIGALTVVEMAAKCKVSGQMRVVDTIEKLDLPTTKKVIQFPNTIQTSQAERNREIYTGYDFTDLESQFYPTDAQKRAHAAQG